MQNFDVQLNLLLVNKARINGCVDVQCVELCCNGVKRCPLFERFVQHLD